MKKILYGFLSVFILLGGIVLSACDGTNVSMTLSTSEVTVYTNDEDAGSRSASVTVTLDGSSRGVAAQIEAGSDVIQTPVVSAARNENEYTVNITGNKGGSATVRVYSVEDPSVYEFINVTSYTYLESMTANELKDENGRSELFVVKGAMEGKSLDAEHYFQLGPDDANVTDIVWSFTDTGTSELLQGENVVAEIIDNQLFVYNNYTGNSVSLTAAFARVPSLNASLSFQVIEDSSITSFRISGTTESSTDQEGYVNFITNGETTNTSATFELVRNDASVSSISGQIVISTSDENLNSDDIELRAYRMVNGSKSYVEFADYFNLVTGNSVYNDVEDLLTFEFKIDAIYTSGEKVFGDFYIEFVLHYSDYAYDVNTSDRCSVLLSTYFIAESVTVRDGSLNNLNETSVDLYSNYTSGFGYEMNVNVYPDDVALQDNSFYIMINDVDNRMSGNDADMDYYIRVFYKDNISRQVTFTQVGSSNTYRSEAITSGTGLYFMSGNVSSKAGFEIRFVAVGNPYSALTSVYANLYQITDETEMSISVYNAELDDYEAYDFTTINYLSSSRSGRDLILNLRITGMASSQGLDLVHDDNSNFDISFVEVGNYEDTADVENSYVNIQITVSLNRHNIQEDYEFYIHHRTGLQSDAILLSAFVPISSVTVANGDSGSVNVYLEDRYDQNFIVDENGEIANSNTYSDESVSNLMVAAGTSLPLSIDFGSATLASTTLVPNGYYLAYMDYESFLNNGLNIDIAGDEEALQERFNKLTLNPNEVSSIDNIYLLTDYFSTMDNTFATTSTYLSYTSSGQLVLTNQEFVVYVAVVFNGFDDDHNSVTLVRFFKLESFYPVNSIRSNLTDIDLYSRESVSSADVSLTYSDINVSMRMDSLKPTYSDLSYFSVSLANGVSYYNEEQGLVALPDGSYASLADSVYVENEYVRLSDFRIDENNRLAFRIEALATLFQSSVREVVTLAYTFFDTTYTIVIHVNILQADRVESVKWVNRTYNDEVYLNLTTNDISQQTFTVSTSVGPDDAYNRQLSYYYHPLGTSTNILDISTTSTSQSFTLTIGSEREGGDGYLYILPSDMIKSVNGTPSILYYGYDENGEISTEAEYISLSSINEQYENLINGTNGFANYFLNNNDERVYYEDIILRIHVIVADGLSEATAIRIYSEEELENIDTTLYYRIMNNLTLTNWRSFENFSGMLFGDTDNITINFSGSDNQSLIANLIGTGTIKNLTFTGNVSGGGFVADSISANALVENVIIDVYYDGKYMPSTVSEGVSAGVSDGVNIYQYAGAITGVNYGTIRNSYAYGVSVSVDVQDYLGYVGGLVGSNAGLIENCGVEFYNFIDEGGQQYNNTLTANYVGGIAGETNAREGGYPSIIDSYVYAYPLENPDAVGGTFNDALSYNNLIGSDNRIPNSVVGEWVGHVKTVTVIQNSFAFMGNLINENMGAALVEQGSQNMLIRENSYVTYYSVDSEDTNTTTRISMSYIIEDEVIDLYYDGSNFYFESDDTLIESWTQDGLGFDSSVWVLENIDSSINFGFPYFTAFTQSVSVSVEQVIQAVEGKVIPVDGQDKAIFLYYETTSALQSNAELSELEQYNTITLSELFGLTSEQARSLLVSVSNLNYLSFTTNSLTAENDTLNLGGRTVTLTLYSRMDLSNSLPFEIMIVNAIPELTTYVDGVELVDGQILNIQTGLDNSRAVEVRLDNSIYLNGNAYELEENTYNYDITSSNEDFSDYISTQISGNQVSLTALEQTTQNLAAEISAGLSILGNDEEYSDFNNAIKANRSREFAISAYTGANSVSVSDLTLGINPSESTYFDVSIVSDNPNEDLVLLVEYDGQTFEIVDNVVEINDNLHLNITWTRQTTTLSDTFSYRVVMDVVTSYRHRVDKDYNLLINVNALSQQNNTTYLRQVSLTVEKQNINDIDLVAYTIRSRVNHNSTWYYTPSDTLSTILTPGSDSIFTLEVNPNYAHYSYFTVNYNVISSGTVGTVSLSRLSYNSAYGYYVDSSSTQNITSGLRVNVTDADLESGTFYFRIYVSSSFASNSNVQLVFTFYDDGEQVASYTYNYDVDYSKAADILVDGEVTTILAKGDSATVTVTTDLDQTFAGISISDHSGTIRLSDVTETTDNTHRIYTATISTYVDSALENSSTGTGVFYVYAYITSVVNGIAQTQQSRATVYLVDFAIDAEATKVSGSSSTTTYNGQTYDVFYAYINSNSVLSFDYTLLPQQYYYDESNADDVAAVQELQQKRQEFIGDGSYADENSRYYINYQRNASTGLYEELTINQRLSYINSNGSVTAIYNSNQGTYIQNSTFDFSGVNGDSIVITGKQAGRILMRLTTTVVIDGQVFSYDYDFVIIVDVWNDEEVPIPIYTAEEFLIYIDGNPDDEGNTVAADYILMDNIVLENYDPRSTQYFNSFDGNGYVIYLNSYNATPTDGALNLALFSEVTENSTIKNVKLNVYNGGQITVNINTTTSVNIAGIANENNGIIYNCDVVAYYNQAYSSSRISGDVGIVVSFVRGNGTDAIRLNSDQVNVSNLVISGFVNENYGIITNSRVGGESLGIIFQENENDSRYYYDEMTLSTFTITGQGYVSGFVDVNSAGTISASKASNVQINNQMNYTGSQTAGFVRQNSGNVNTSYIQGVADPDNASYYFNGSSISSTGRVGGFVYSNSGSIENSYVNIAFEVDTSRSYLSAGFVYENDADGTITLCYAAAQMSNSDINEMSFSGVNERGEDMNQNPEGITYSYYYSESRVDSSTQAGYDIGAYAVTDVDQEETFYRFSFADGDGAQNGVWTMTDRGITLTSANNVAISHRYIVYSSESQYSLFYSTVTDYDSYRQLNLAYGSYYNPIIIRNADDFAKATGADGQEVELSSYRQYYNDDEVFGNYRLVNQIDLSEIDQNTEGTGNLSLNTPEKVFSGVLDGNGFSIVNINLGSSNSVENYGLFEQIVDGIVINLGLQVDSVHNTNANIVGTLAGTVVDSSLVSIDLSPIAARSEEDVVEAISISGYNVVGGLVGMVFGNSRLMDITVTDIDVDSGFYDNAKEVGDNVEYIGEKGLILRTYIDAGASISQYVREISYAGGVAGYIDIYDSISDGSVEYSEINSVSGYSVATIRVVNTVDVYGEVAGGLFGFLGKSTRAYDLGLELDANMALENPSYITSKNLYAGGIVGESYGGLYAVYAEYESELQTTIENNMYSYYNSSPTVERGQTSIFSYTTSDTKHYGSRYNNPYYIGGIVGYAGSGYIATSYNKLNVVSNEIGEKTIAVGGIVGYVNVSDQDTYNASFMFENPQISYFIHEVYFSGVLNAISRTPSESDTTSVTKTTAGGIVGMLNNSDTILALQFVNSVPYYDTSSDTSAVFGLIGGLNETPNKNVENGEYVYSGEDIYLMNTSNGYYSVKDGEWRNNSASVATSIGVSAEYLGSDDVATDDNTRMNYINGFTDSFVASYIDEDGLTQPMPEGEIETGAILQIESVSHMATPSVGYARMINYFQYNDWDQERWDHEVDHLFPDIVLVPKLNVLYLDAYEESIIDVLDEIRGTSMTVVVRGRVSATDENTHSDVDLRNYLAEYGPVTNFSGTFISYESYMNNTDEGTVSQEVRDKNNVLEGGVAGSNVGLIIDQPLFSNAVTGFEINDLNIYFSSPNFTAYGSGSSLLIEGVAENATFTGLNLYVAEGVELKGELNGDSAYAGLIVPLAYATSFIDINIIFRNDALSQDGGIAVEFTIPEETAGVSLQNLYFGLLTGQIIQNSVYRSVQISNISISAGTQISNLNFLVSTANDVYDFLDASDTSIYAGLYAGNISDGNNAETGSSLAEKNLYLGALTSGNSVGSIGLTVSGDSTKKLSNLYVGGYFGNASFDTIEIVDDVSGQTGISSLNIRQDINVENLYAGLGFGRLNGNLTLQDGILSETFSVSGSLIQGSYTTGTADSETGNAGTTNYFTTGSEGVKTYIGGFIGLQASGNFAIENNSVIDFDLMRSTVDDKSINDSSIYVENSVDKDKCIDSYTIGGIAYVGSIIGYKLGGRFSSSGLVNIGGDVRVYTQDASTEQGALLITLYYGAIAYLDGNLEISMLATGDGLISNVNAFLVSEKNSVIGGIFGYSNVSGSQATISKTAYSGTVISISDEVVFGGIVGRMGASSYEISDSMFGGTFKSVVNDSEKYITVGGIVGITGKAGVSDLTRVQVSGCFSYGDAFVIYEDKNTRLEEYFFGGIIGDYSSTTSATSSNISVGGCYSIMSTFNDRISVGGLKHNSYEANAIVGHGHESITYTDTNYYSSGVNFAYQDGNNNIDLGYYNINNAGTSYFGYSTEISALTERSQNILSSIRNKAVEFLGETTVSRISKLNPVLINNGSSSINSDIDSGEDGEIAWYYLNGYLSRDNERYIVSKTDSSNAVRDFSNAVIVGNGNTVDFDVPVNVNDYSSNSNNNYGLLVDTLGTKSNSFTAITGIVVDGEFAVDINLASGYLNSLTQNVNVGTVAGTIGDSNNNSSVIIYGVGVNNSISVGGNKTMMLGGIVGLSYTGLISNSYVDSTLTYHAGVQTNSSNGVTTYSANGRVSGIGNMGGISHIINSFTVGEIDAYVPVNISSFNNKFTESDDEALIYIYDCYSVSNIVTKDYGYGTSSESIDFTSTANTNLTDISYINADNYAVINEDKSANSINHNYEDNNNPYYSTWFFSPYRNYGYATNGFGYLRNISVYSREKSSQEDSSSEINSYTYTRLENASDNFKNLYGNDATDDFKDDVYSAIHDIGQFTLMMQNSSELDITNLFVKYDLELNEFKPNSSWVAKQQLGSESKTIYIDGQEHIIEFDNTAGLFSTAYAEIENLRIIANNNITSSNIASSDSNGITYYGILAGRLEGSLTNITVEGNIVKSESDSLSGENHIGGVVGELEGNISVVQNLVNIRVVGGSNVIGGVVGWLHGSASYSTNAGNIVSDNSSTSNLLAIKAERYSGRIDYRDVSLNNILGGIAGIVEGDNISYSYNTSSIMNGYANTSTDVGDLVAGGIAGVAATNIENSFNTGYIVAGNNGNKATAFAGGIVGYTTGEVNNCVNDAKVQAVSDINNADYDLSMSVRVLGVTNRSNITGNTIDFTFTITMTYNNTNENRLVFAYGIGYSYNESNNEVFSDNINYNDDIVNDGNIGKTSRKLKFVRSTERYGGVDSSGHFRGSRYGVRDYIYYVDGDRNSSVSGTFDKNSLKDKIDVSAYDSYGFPSRFNLNYIYDFDFTAFQFDGGLYDQNVFGDGNIVQVSINDSNPNNRTGNWWTEDNAVSGNIISVNYNTYYPGGETQKYFSLPFYDLAIDEGNNSTNYSYEQLVEEMNNLSSNNKTNENKFNDSVKEKLTNLYSEITSQISGDQNTTTININGESYTTVDRNLDFSSIIGGYEISGSIELSDLEVQVIEQNLLNASNSVSAVRIAENSISLDKITLYNYIGNSKNAVVVDGKNVEELFTETRLANDGNNNYSLDYSVYYSMSTLSKAGIQDGSYLGVDIDYSINYFVEGSVTLTNSNMSTSWQNGAYNLVVYNLDQDGEITSFDYDDIMIGDTIDVTLTTADGTVYTAEMIVWNDDNDNPFFYGLISGYQDSAGTTFGFGSTNNTAVLEFAELMHNGTLTYEIEHFIEITEESTLMNYVVNVPNVNKITENFGNTVTGADKLEAFGSFGTQNNNVTYTINLNDFRNYSSATLVFGGNGATQTTTIDIVEQVGSEGIYDFYLGGSLLNLNNGDYSQHNDIRAIINGKPIDIYLDIVDYQMTLTFVGLTDASTLISDSGTIVTAESKVSSIEVEGTMEDYQLFSNGIITVTGTLTLDRSSIDGSHFSVSDPDGNGYHTITRIDGITGGTIDLNYNVSNIDYTIAPSTFLEDYSYQVSTINGDDSTTLIFFENHLEPFRATEKIDGENLEGLRESDYYGIEIYDKTDGTSYTYANGIYDSSFLGNLNNNFNGRNYVRTQIVYDVFDDAGIEFVLTIDNTTDSSGANYRIFNYNYQINDNFTVASSDGEVFDTFSYIRVVKVDDSTENYYIEINGQYYTAPEIDEEYFLSAFALQNIQGVTISGNSITSLEFNYSISSFDDPYLDFSNLISVAGDESITGGQIEEVETGETMEDPVTGEIIELTRKYFAYNGREYNFSLTETVSFGSSSGINFFINLDINEDGNTETYRVNKTSYTDEQGYNADSLFENLIKDSSYRYYLVAELYQFSEREYVEEMISAIVGHYYDLAFVKEYFDMLQSLTDVADGRFVNRCRQYRESIGMETCIVDLFYGSDNLSLSVSSNGSEFEYFRNITSTTAGLSILSDTDTPNQLRFERIDDSCGEMSFNYEFYAKFLFDEYSYVNSEPYSAGELTGSNIILTNNIMYDKAIAVIDMNIYADNYSVTNYDNSISSDKENMISISGDSTLTNAKIISIGSVSYFSSNEEISQFYISGENSIIGNISLYGSIRNINEEGVENSVVNVSVIVSDISNTSANLESQVTSYTSLIGSDAENVNAVSSSDNPCLQVYGNNSLTTLTYKGIDGNSVYVNLSDYQGLDETKIIQSSESYIVLIAGNASNGANGANGAIGHKNGYSGGFGGTGGTISDNANTSGVFILGADGKGGSGGNGHDGANAYGTDNLNMTQSVGGGAGGNYGYNGEDETGFASKTNRVYNDRAGSGGTGGLGLIYYNVDIPGGGSNDKGVYDGGTNNRYNKNDSGADFQNSYITAAGGGASGGAPNQFSAPGSNGSIIRSSGSNAFYIDRNNTKLAGVSYYWRLHAEEYVSYNWWAFAGAAGGILGLIIGHAVAVGEYVTAKNNTFNERLFGNLQLITTFSSWRQDVDNNEDKGCVHYDFDSVNDYVEGFKKYLEYGSFNTSNGSMSGANIWKDYFYGGLGGEYIIYDNNGNMTSSGVSGGRAYTSEIYGFMSQEGQDGKNFFSRDDFVTNGGSYGVARNLGDLS